MEAEPLVRRSIAIREKALVSDHPDFFRSMETLAGLLEATDRFQEAIPLRRRILEAQERRLGPEHPDTLRSWNQHTYALRKQGRAESAEPIDRKVAATTAKMLGNTNPLTIHRRNNLVLTLIMLGKLAEAREILAANWRLNAPAHANTTPRIAFLRHLIARLESQPDTPFLGQLKTLLTSPDTRRTGVAPVSIQTNSETAGTDCPTPTPELPVASDVAVPWDIAYFIDSFNSKLEGRNSKFLRALVAALNDRAELSTLDSFPEWRDEPPVPLDTPWPD